MRSNLHQISIISNSRSQKHKESITMAVFLVGSATGKHAEQWTHAVHCLSLLSSVGDPYSFLFARRQSLFEFFARRFLLFRLRETLRRRQPNADLNLNWNRFEFRISNSGRCLRSLVQVEQPTSYFFGTPSLTI